jgi:hypothetical protein
MIEPYYVVSCSDATDRAELDDLWAQAADCQIAVLHMTLDDEFTVTSGQSTAPQQTSRGATAPTTAGLTKSAFDGERLGRMAWMPGARCGS